MTMVTCKHCGSQIQDGFMCTCQYRQKHHRHEAVCKSCGKKFLTDVYDTCGMCLARPIARGVDASILQRVLRYVKDNDMTIDLKSLRPEGQPMSEFVAENQARRRRDGDSREPDGTTWRDRPSLF